MTALTGRPRRALGTRREAARSAEWTTPRCTGTFGYKPRHPGPAPKRRGSLLLGRRVGRVGAHPWPIRLMNHPHARDVYKEGFADDSGRKCRRALYRGPTAEPRGVIASPRRRVARARSPMAVTKYVRNPRVMLVPENDGLFAALGTQPPRQGCLGGCVSDWARPRTPSSAAVRGAT